MSVTVILNHFLVVGGFVLALLLSGRILREHRPPGNTVAWILAILLIPYVGVPLYLLIGGRKMKRLASLKESVESRELVSGPQLSGTNTEKILHDSGCPNGRSGNRIQLLLESSEAARGLFALIDDAKRSLYVETFILSPDAIGRAVVERLTERAKAGIRVRLLVDAWGSWQTSGRFLKPLRRAGAEVGVFLPFLPVQRRWSVNLRNHRKIWIADETRAIIGGRNIGKEYLGENPKAWADCNVLVEGPAVSDLTRIFASDWNFATGKTLDLEKDVTPPNEATSSSPHQSYLQIVAAGPDTPANRLYEGILTSLLEAKSRIWCVTPYFVPDETLVQSLTLMARLGRDVRIIVPRKSNHPIADFARGSYLRELQSRGIHCYGYEGGMLHTKLILIDEKIAILGSANLDMRSLLLNYEVASFCYSPNDIQQVSQHILSLLAKCQPLDMTTQKRGDKVRVWFEDIGRLFAPLL